MKNIKVLISIFFITLVSILYILPNNVIAVSLTVTASKTITVGETGTITIGNGVTGRVDITSSNPSVASVSTSKLWIENGSASVSITAKKEGTATITVTANSLASADDGTPVSGSKTCTVTVKAKETPKTQTEQSTQKTTTTTKTNTKKNTTTTKKTETVKPTEEKEEATPQWGISEVKLTAIKENEEKVDIELDKKFNINTYEYTCNVGADVKKIEISQESHEYNDFVTISGIEEELKTGENIITLKLAKDGQKELIYTIKVNKEAKPEEETQEVSAEVDTQEQKEENKGIMVSMPLGSFIVLQISIIAVTALITVFTTKVITRKKNNKINTEKQGEVEK